MLRRMFGRKSGEVTGGCRELRNEELHNLYSSLNNIRMRFLVLMAASIKITVFWTVQPCSLFTDVSEVLAV
jgi:hypothetical protein